VADFSRTIEAVLGEVSAEGADLLLRFEPVRGDRTPIEDRVRLAAPEEISTIRGVGRLLRILKAARVQPPADPYALARSPGLALELLRRCTGARVVLRVTRRIERVLTIWTDAGVDRISDVLDFEEDAEGLSVRRRGGQSVLRIPRRSLIRFASASRSRPEILSVEIPPRGELR
jgi:hypothetical protein